MEKTQKTKRARMAVDIMLFAVLICQPLGGIMLSKHLFTFLPTAGYCIGKLLKGTAKS